MAVDLQFDGYFQQPPGQSVSQRNRFAAASALELGTAGHVGPKRKFGTAGLWSGSIATIFALSLHPPGERYDRRKCIFFLPASWAGGEMKSSPSLINRTPAVHGLGRRQPASWFPLCGGRIDQLASTQTRAGHGSFEPDLLTRVTDAPPHDVLKGGTWL